MAEVVVQFDTRIRSASGGSYLPRVCGRRDGDGLWEGWIEFEPEGGAPVLRTPQETKQPNRKDLEYWATGLTETYLEGALERALHPAPASVLPPPVAAEPAYDAPAAPPSAPGAGAAPHAVLDPFQVYAQGEDVLRGELSALDEGHLRNVARAYRLTGLPEAELRAMTRAALVEIIALAVRDRAGA